MLSENRETKTAIFIIIELVFKVFEWG